MDKILELYKTGLTIQQVADQTGLTWWVCRGAIIRAGLIRPKGVPKTGVGLSEEIKSQVNVLYLSGMSGAAIAKQLGINRHMAYACLGQLDAPMRDRSHCKQTYSVNELFFDAIDTEEKAYWLGFIAADGNVHKNTFQIDLSVVDRQHLEKLRLAILSTHPIKDRDSTRHGKVNRQSRFSFSNEIFVQCLARQGIGERKSATVEAWQGPSELLPHYWRGVIDGDGSIFFEGRHWIVSLNGSRAMCQSFLDWSNAICLSEAKIGPGHGNVWQVRLASTSAVSSVVSAMYSKALISLDRKVDLARQAIEQPQSSGGMRIRDENGIEYESISEAARKLGGHKGVISKFLKGQAKSAGGHTFSFVEI